MRISSVRVEMVKEKWVSYEGPSRVGDAEAAVELFRKRIGESDREQFVVVPLNAKNKPLGIHTVSIGTLNAAMVHPREVYKIALLSNAAAIVACHNHPSGDPAPSRDDMELTKKLKEAGELLGVRLLDHIILGDDDFFSFANTGKL